MNISKELIEKYHKGACTSEEKKAVEEWLLEDTNDLEYHPEPIPVNKIKLKEEMWQEIATVLPSQRSVFSRVLHSTFTWQAAAILLIALAGLSALYLSFLKDTNEVLVANNPSLIHNHTLNENAYFISLGPKSNVQIDKQSGQLQFCGTMMINPKQDIEFIIEGNCSNPVKESEKVVLKKGNYYIALQYGTSSTQNEILILPQGALNGLPPLMQRQLMKQFNI